LIGILDATNQTTATAADFSNFVVPHPSCISHSGAILIKLFETIPDSYGVANAHLTELTSQWWQLVYRTNEDGNDVLTLWMVQPYRLTHFNGTRYDINFGMANEQFIEFPSITVLPIPENNLNTIQNDEQIANELPACNYFFFEGNYSTSIARANLLRDAQSLFNHFQAAEHFLMTPQDIPSNWQSSLFQTGSNSAMRFYVSGEFQTTSSAYSGSLDLTDGLGAAGLIWGNHLRFNLVNGKDGLSVGPHYGHWPHTMIVPTYFDLLWLPSDFEIRSMGHDRDGALFQTFVADATNPASALRWNYEHDRESDWRYQADNSGGRSGLWQLNGFDRAFFSTELSWEMRLSWLRSADSATIGNANTVYHTDNRYSYPVNQMAGMRPAVHLSITRLLESLEYIN